MGDVVDGLVDGGGVLMDNGGLDDFVDGVHLVGSGDGDGSGDLDGVGLLDVLLNNDLSVDGDGDLDGDLDGITVDLEFGLDAGHLGSDDGVGASRGADPFLGDGISGSRALVGGCGGDSGIGSSVGDREGGGSNGHGVLGVGGFSGDVGVGRLGLNGLSGNEVFVSDLDGLGADLDGLVSDHTVLHVGLGDGGASVVGFGHVGHGGTVVHGGGHVGGGVHNAVVAGSSTAGSEKGSLEKIISGLGSLCIFGKSRTTTKKIWLCNQDVT